MRWRDETVVRSDRGEMPRMALLEPFLALMPDAAVVVDADGQIVCANDQAAVLFGRPPDEMVGRPVETLIPERFRGQHHQHRADYGRAPRARLMGTGDQLSGRRGDGTEFPIDVSLAPLEGPDGPLVVAAIRDATERRAATEAQAQLAAIVLSSSDAIVSTTLEGEITTWNPGAAQLFGYPSDEMVGRHISVLVPEEESASLEELLAAALAGEPNVAHDTRWLCRDGTRLDVALTVSALCDAADRPLGFSAILRDITERRRTEDALTRAGVAHEQLAMIGDRERIARDLHDLVIQRLFAAGMGLEGLLRSSTDERVNERLERTMQELDGTIRDIRTTIFALDPPAGATGGLRAQLIRVANEAADTLGFEPGLRFDGPVDAAVPADVVPHVLAVAREALSNTARHARASRVQVELSVGDTLLLVVVDDGDGLGDGDRRSGLANLHQRADSLGGSIEITSPPGGGTRIEWRVPLAP